jgi:hypothetical protein
MNDIRQRAIQVEAAERTNLRSKAIGGALILALAAASMAPAASNAYALKINLGRAPGDQTHAEREQSENDPSIAGALSRKCPDILAAPADYDDLLIAMCLKAQRRP